MKKKFNIDDYKGCYVMHCDTYEKCKKFCKYLHLVSKRYVAFDGDEYFDYKDKTCYAFNNVSCGAWAAYDKNCYEKYSLLEFDDFDWLSPKPLVVTAVDFVPPKTIISWSDGSTTVVKCTACVEKGTEKCIYCKTQSYWRESGIIHAMCKKAFGKEYFRVLDEYCEEDD